MGLVCLLLNGAAELDSRLVLERVILSVSKSLEFPLLCFLTFGIPPRWGTMSFRSLELYRLVFQSLGYKLVWLESICGNIRQRNMRDIEQALCRGGGWLVSMQHFRLHDCVVFATWYVFVIGGGVVALCMFCDAPTPPVDAHFCGLELLWWLSSGISPYFKLWRLFEV